jgi:putative SOS response-associated peptidase YedK
MCFSIQVDTDLKRLSQRFDAVINETAFEHYRKLENQDSQKYKYVYPEDQRVFSKVWTPIICEVRGVREIRPMRYQLLPHFCEEEIYTRMDEKTGKKVEVKNTFNARLDSLSTARAWQKPFMRFHAMLPVKKFYEWVPKGNFKGLISFYPENEDYMLIPCLYDNWYSQDKSKIIQSFAIITDEPRPEVLAMGHDRTPISLDEDKLDEWLRPHLSDQATIYQILQSPIHSSYKYQWLS